MFKVKEQVQCEVSCSGFRFRIMVSIHVYGENSGSASWFGFKFMVKV